MTTLSWFCCINLIQFGAKLILCHSGQLFWWFFSRPLGANFKFAGYPRTSRALLKPFKSYACLSILRCWPKTTFSHFVNWALGLDFNFGPAWRRPQAPLEPLKSWGYVFILRVWPNLDYVKNRVFALFHGLHRPPRTRRHSPKSFRAFGEHFWLDDFMTWKNFKLNLSGKYQGIHCVIDCSMVTMAQTTLPVSWSLIGSCLMKLTAWWRHSPPLWAYQASTSDML
jgi:hypothetical protein